jgi:hypothetical protein
MPTLEHCPCPICDRPGHLLKSISEFARVDYYRCIPCEHIWTTPKSECEPAIAVTVKM